MRNNRFIVLAVFISGILIIAALGIAMQSKPVNKSPEFSATDRLIQAAQQRLEKEPKNPDRHVALCQLYLQKIRETAQNDLYQKCTDLLDIANSIEDDNSEIFATQASVAYGKHSFKEGLAYIEKAIQLNPNLAAYYGLQGDGQIELGKYQEAVASFQKMVNIKPDLTAFNRIAFIRELNGDVEGAKTALRSAITSGSSFAENVAYSQTELGKLQMRTNLDEAEATYRQALQTFPDYAPALEGLGKVAFARKNYQDAQIYFQKAFDSLPLAHYANALGDTYVSSGSTAKAKQQYALAEIALNNSSAGGVNNDYEVSVFLAQRNKDASKAVSLAQSTVDSRPNIFSYDALAWALFRDSKYTEAQDSINKALSLGEHEPVILYHAGMIAEKLGQRKQAINYLNKASRFDTYFLDSHFSLLDLKDKDRALKRLGESA